MAVTFDTVGPGSSGTSSATSPLAWAHTCGASATVLYACVAVDATTTDTGISASATYNTVAMSSLLRWESGGSGQDTGFLQVFYMFSPPTGSAYNVSVSVTGGTFDVISGGSISFDGAAQQSSATHSDSNGANVTAWTISVPTTSTANQVCVFQCNGSGSATITSGNEAFIFNGGPGDGSAADCLGAYATATGSSVTVAGAQASDFYACIGVEVQQSTGGSGPQVNRQLPNMPWPQVFAAGPAGRGHSW